MSSSPSSATIPSLAAIYGSDTPPQDTEVSDVSVGNDDDDTSDDDEDNGSGDEGSDDEETEDAAFDCATQEIMNRAGRRWNGGNGGPPLPLIFWGTV